MAQMLTRSEIARTPDETAVAAAAVAPLPRSLPVRLVRRVVDVFQVSGAGTAGRRSLPARLILIGTRAEAPPAPPASTAPPVPVRLLARWPEAADAPVSVVDAPGWPVPTAPAPPAPVRPIPVPLRVARPAPSRPRRGRGTGFYYRVAITALLTGAVITVLGQGTFATFNASVRDSAVISTGTLVLGDTVNAATECFSFTGGANTIDSQNANSGCDTLWTVSGVSAEPGKAITAPQVTVALHGSLTASTFTLYAKQPVPAANPGCTSSATAGETYNGGANLCTVLQVYVQQYTSNTFTTASKCLYGAGIGGVTCTGFDATHTLADFGNCHKPASNIACAGGEATGPLAIAIPVGPTPTAYFKVFANLPLNIGNTYQGQASALGFTWAIGQ